MKKENNGILYKAEDNIRYIIKPEERIIIGKYYYPGRYLTDMILNSRANDLSIYNRLKEHKEFHDRPDVITAVAKCDPRDEFDVELGMKIVRSKIDYKRHMRAAMDMSNMKDISDRISDNLAKHINHHLKKAENISNDYWTYFMRDEVKNE